MTNLHALKCPNCSAGLGPEDCQLHRGTVRCSYCRAVSLVPGYEAADEARPRPVVSLPEGMTLDATAEGTVITRRWFGPVYVFLAVFCAVWDSVLVFFYLHAFSKPTHIMETVFPLGHVVAGIVVTYITIAGFLNRTTIKVTNGAIDIKHGPVPWAGSTTHSSSNIKQLYCKEKGHRNDDNRRIDYEVWMGQHDGKAKKLLGGILSEEQAIYIEQRIEAALKIADCLVAGELRR